MKEGTTLAEGRYELISLLGTGGMAEVWRAYDHRLSVERAIKLMSRRHLRSGNALVRFEREAKVMAQLEHPHVVPIHDIGAEGEQHYLVMSLLGGSLQDELERDGRVHPSRAARLVQGVLDALAAAHTHGVVHRDVKPHNVLMDERDQARLTDFGIATDPDGHGLTRTGAVMGTLAYMAPEQRASARQVDARADVYAVGALLYALVTGDDPTELDHPDGRDERLARLPAALVPFVEQATRRRAADRFDDASDALAHLRDASEVLPEEATVQGRPGKAWKPATGATMDLEALVALEAPTNPTLQQTASEAAVDPEAATVNRNTETVLLAPIPLDTTSEGRTWLPWVLGAAAVGALVLLVLLLVLPQALLPAVVKPAQPVAAPVQAPAVPLAEPVVEPEPTPVPIAAPPPAPVVVPAPAPSPTPLPPAEPSTTQGTIFLSSIPASDLWVDGEKVGSTPRAVTLDVGRRRIEFRTAERQYARVIEVGEGKNDGMCWDLVAEAACKR